MGAADRLIAELAAEGRHDSEGRFTLDRDRAREKMRLFQLPDPSWYVLQLVQAALLRGARRVRFDIDADDAWITFDGEPFTEDDFEHLYGSLLSSTPDSHLEARRELALGLNAVMAFGPRRVRVTSGAATLEMRPGREDRWGSAEELVEGTRIHVKQRLHPQLVSSFFKNLAGTLHEERLLRERCRYADAEIDLEGSIISQGLAPYGCRAGVTFRGKALDCAFGLFPEDGATGLLFVTNGVSLERHENSGLLPGILAIVSATGLRKNVSQTDVVRDERYDEVVAAVCRLQWDALPRLLDAVVVSSEQDLTARLDWLLRRVLTRPGGLDALRARRASDGSTPGLDWAFTRPLWETVEGGHANLDAVALELERHGTVQTSTVRCEEPFDDERPFAILLDDEADPLLRQVTGGALEDVSAAVLVKVQRRANIEAWRARSHPPALDDVAARYAAKAAIEADGVQGEVGLRALPREALHLALIKDGCLLVERRVRFGVLGLDVVLEADFNPSPLFNDVEHDEVEARALAAMLDALGPLLEEVALGDTSDVWIRRCLQSFVLLLGRRPAREKALRDLGVEDKLAREVSAARARPWTLHTVLLGQGRSLANERYHPLLGVPLIPTWQQELVSGLDIHESVRAFGSLWTVPAGMKGLENPKSLPDSVWAAAIALERWPDDVGPPRPDELRRRPIVKLTKVGEAILRVVVTPPRQRSVERACRHLEGAERFLAAARTESAVARDATPLAKVRVDEEEVTGEVALLEDLHVDEGSIVLFLDGRRLGAIPHCFGVPRLTAALRHDGLTPAEGWSSAEEGPATAAVRRAMARALPDLVTGVAGRRARRWGGDRVERALRRLAAGPFPTGAHRLAYERLRRAFTADEAEAHYRALLALDVATGFTRVRAILIDRMRNDEALDAGSILTALVEGRWIDADATPRVEALLADPLATVPPGSLDWLDVLFPEREAPADLRVLSPHEALATAPLFEDLNGRRVTLEEVIAEHRAKGEVLALRRRPARVEPLDRLILFTPSRHTRDTLRAILGENPTNAAEWLDAQRRRRLRERYPRIATFSLDEAEALVTARVTAGPIEAVVGLTASHPRLEEGDHEVRLCVDDRLVETRHHRDVVHQISLVRDADLAMNREWSKIARDPNAERRAKLLGSAGREQLIDALTDAWESFDEGQRAQARRHALDLLLWAARSAESARADEARIERLRSLPVLRTVSGEHLAIADVATGEATPVRYVEREDARGEPLDPSMLVLALGEWEAARLRESNSVALRRWTVEWDRERALLAWLEHAPPLPSPEELEAIVCTSEGLPRGIEGVLALPRTERVLGADEKAPAVSLGVRGRLVEERGLSKLFPCAGVLSCPTSWFDASDLSVRLSPHQVARLELAAARLYRELCDRFEQDRFDGWEERRVARSHLAAALHALVRHRKDTTLRWSRLARRLRSLPLFVVDGDQAVSLDVAMQERPPELSSLGLFDSRLADVERAAEPPAGTARDAGQALLVEEARAAGPGSGPVAPDATSRSTVARDGSARPAPTTAPAWKRGFETARAGEKRLAPRRPSRADEMLEALRRRLQSLHDDDGPLLERTVLDRLRLSSDRDHRKRLVVRIGPALVLQGAHPAVKRALETYADDPLVLDFLASTVITTINHASPRVTDEHEAKLHARLVEIIHSELTTRART